MSVSGVSSNFFQSNLTQGAQNKFQQIQSQFQQLGKDLQSGNLSQAQQDFATLTQELPSSQQQTGAATSTSSIAQAFKTLGQDLQSGNLSAAQQDFAAIQQNAQQASGSAPGTSQPSSSRHLTPASRAPVRSRKPLERSAKPCNPAISPPRSKPTPRFSRICSSTCRAPAPARPAPRPPHYAHRAQSA